MYLIKTYLGASPHDEIPKQLGEKKSVITKTNVSLNNFTRCMGTE